MVAAAIVVLYAGAFVAQSADTPGDWTDFVTRGGLLGAAVLTVWAFYTGRVVTGAACNERLGERDERIDEEKARAEEWRRIAVEQTLPLTEKAVDVAKRA